MTPALFQIDPRDSTATALRDMEAGETALGITLAQNRMRLTKGPLVIDDVGDRVDTIEWSPRIGISVGVDRPWRCTLAGSRAVSRPARATLSAKG